MAAWDEVTDRGGGWARVLPSASGAADGEAEDGRGLWLVDMLLAQWVTRGGGLATT